ncbi:MAG: hypothetical protein WA705_28155 [Candidatus Ozemobacteraceae bacterium]
MRKILFSLLTVVLLVGLTASLVGCRLGGDYDSGPAVETTGTGTGTGTDTGTTISGKVSLSSDYDNGIMADLRQALASGTTIASGANLTAQLYAYTTTGTTTVGVAVPVGANGIFTIPVSKTLKNFYVVVTYKKLNLYAVLDTVPTAQFLVTERTTAIGAVVLAAIPSGKLFTAAQVEAQVPADLTTIIAKIVAGLKDAANGTKGIVNDPAVKAAAGKLTVKTLSSIAVVPSTISVAKNGTYNLTGITVTATYSDASHATVTGIWSGTGVTGTTYTAPNATGSATILCTYIEGGVTKTASVAVTITGPKTLSSISLSSTTLSVVKNGTFNLAGITVTALYSDATHATVTGIWSGTGVNGTTYTAPSASGSATIVCTYIENGATKTASIAVTITDVAPKTLASIAVAPSSFSVAKNGTYNLSGITVTATYSDSTHATVTGTWSGTGVSGTTYTAPSAAGNATIVCTYIENGITKTANVAVTITDVVVKTLSSISVAPSSFTVAVSGTYNLTGIIVTATYSDSTHATVTGTWSGTGVSGTTYTAPTTAGNATVVCTYSDGLATKTADVAVTITGAVSGKLIVPFEPAVNPATPMGVATTKVIITKVGLGTDFNPTVIIKAKAGAEAYTFIKKTSESTADKCVLAPNQTTSTSPVDAIASLTFSVEIPIGAHISIYDMSEDVETGSTTVSL